MYNAVASNTSQILIKTECNVIMSFTLMFQLQLSISNWSNFKFSIGRPLFTEPAPVRLKR